MRRAPSDKAVLRELHTLRQLLKEERAASGKLFKGAFGAPPAPKPGGGLPATLGGERASGGGLVPSGGQRGGGGAAWLLAALWAALAWLLGGVQRLVLPQKRTASRGG
jgi:hypothetical protein